MPTRYWPVGKDRIITSPFGPRAGGFHYGVDFGKAGGSGWWPVYAIQSGTVIHAGAASGYGGPDPAGWLVIDSTDAEGGGCLEYGHIVRRCNKGDHIEAGQIIAIINPDSATNGGVAPHLHLSDIPGGYDPNTKQDPLIRLAGAVEPDTGPAIPGRAPVVLGPINSQENPMPVSGDPVWLEEVLRAALGDRLVVEPGWKDRGAGGVMGVIWGTMIHHTGNVNESVAVIRDGVQQPTGWLPGPLSQGLIKPDGTFHLIAVGPCNHAGTGNWGTLTDGNRQSIGFECAYSGSGPWPQKQIITMRDATAAVSKKIGKRAADSVCGHKEYAKPQGRKIDPGNMDMNWFRDEVQKDLDGFVFPGEPLVGVPPVPPPPTTPTLSDRQLLQEVWDQLRGPGGGGWPQLGGRSLVDALAELLDEKAGA